MFFGQVEMAQLYNTYNFANDETLVSEKQVNFFVVFLYFGRFCCHKTVPTF